MYRKPLKIARFSNGIQNRLALKRFSLICGSSGQIDESMIPATKRRHRFSECLVPMRSKDAGTGEIVCYRRVGVSSSEPEVIGNSSHSNSVPAEQVDVIILLLSDLALLARGRDGWRQLTGAAFHV